MWNRLSNTIWRFQCVEYFILRIYEIRSFSNRVSLCYIKMGSLFLLVRMDFGSSSHTFHVISLIRRYQGYCHKEEWAVSLDRTVQLAACSRKLWTLMIACLWRLKISVPVEEMWWVASIYWLCGTSQGVCYTLTCIWYLISFYHNRKQSFTRDVLFCSLHRNWVTKR